MFQWLPIISVPWRSQCPFVTKVALLQPFGVGMGQDLVGQKYRGDPSATNSLRDRHREKHRSGFRSNLEA